MRTPLIAALLLMASCGPARVALNPAVRGDPPSISVRADWNDVDAAAEIGGPQVELAQLARSLKELPDGREERMYTFLATDDTEFELTVRQAKVDSGESESGTLILTAQGRRHRDPHREGLLVSAVARRLEDLAGKEWAPVRE